MLKYLKRKDIERLKVKRWEIHQENMSQKGDKVASYITIEQQQIL